jgi:hypothetical protein
LNKTGRLSKKKVQKLNDARSVSYPEAQWSLRYEEFTQYIKEHGNALVPKRYEKNAALGMWVLRQRQEYKAGRLSKKKVQKLNDAGFVWDPNEDHWLERFEELEKYVREHGNALVHHRYKKNEALGMWVSHQRRQYKGGKLSEEKIQKLEIAGFVWDPLEAQWLERYNELKAYVKEHGDALVPKRYKKHPALVEWIFTQRRFYKFGKLSADRIQKLEAVGFVWDARKGLWLERHEELGQYVKKHGNALVPDKYKENQALSTWVHTQRQEYKAGRLAKKRVQMLEALGFVWVAK